MGGLHAAALALTAFALAGCSGGQSLYGDSGSPPAPPAPEVAMAGRWMLSAPNAPACGMNFAGEPGKQEGTIAPEGGCPERFFTSRRWTLRQGALTINDHENNALAELNFSGGRFEGKSNTGAPVTLAR